MSVDSSKMRACVNSRTTDTIEAHFIYFGGTAQESGLGSGEVRRQFGLKLHAQNACNPVYAMWRIGDSHTLGAELHGVGLRMILDGCSGMG